MGVTGSLTVRQERQTACMGGKANHTHFWWANLKLKTLVEVLYVCGRIILK
jgi:hypothetical protein